MEYLTMFHLFTNLPSELRIKIWQHASPEPRIVPVLFNHTMQQYTSTSEPPALLHVCVESRTVLLYTYTNLILSPKYPSVVFVDFARDTIFFKHLDCSPDGDLALDLARSPHSNQIQNCAIESNLWEVLRVFKYDPLSEIKLMPNLKTIALVLSKDYDRGIRHRLMEEEDGHENIFVEVDSNTVGSEIRHVHWYVESLRWELKHGLEIHWNTPPHVQMWLV
jgi:hypothetical protein